MSHAHRWEYPKDPRPGMVNVHGLYRTCKCGAVQTYQAVKDTCGMAKFQREPRRG